jgi:hypothetical protein
MGSRALFLFAARLVSIGARDGLLGKTPNEDGAGKLPALDGETICENCRANTGEDSAQVGGPLMVKHGQ